MLSGSIALMLSSSIQKSSIYLLQSIDLFFLVLMFYSLSSPYSIFSAILSVNLLWLSSGQMQLKRKIKKNKVNLVKKKSAARSANTNLYRIR